MNEKKRLKEGLQGKVCVFLFSIMAIDQKQAIEKARKRIDQVLHIMRLYFGSHVFHSLPTPNLFKAISKKSIGVSRPLEVQDELCTIASNEEDGLIDHMLTLYRFVEGGSMPEMEISKALLRAIRWFGSAVQDKEMEDKLVKYIFALETLLVPEDRGGKRARLTFRVVLLQLRVNRELPYSNFPNDLNHFYQKRNQIVHGGDIKGEPITKEDIHLLERLTRRVIHNTSSVIIDNPGAITDVPVLKEWIQREDKQLVDIYRFISHHGDEELKEYAASVSSPLILRAFYLHGYLTSRIL